MGQIDNTTYLYILSQLSGKDIDSIFVDLKLSGRNIRTRTRNGDNVPGFGYKKPFWPNQDLWRGQTMETSSVPIDFDVFDSNKQLVDEQPFPDKDHPKEYSFNSLACETLKNYIACYCSGKYGFSLFRAKKKICECLEEFYAPELCADIRAQRSIDNIARYIVTSAAKAPKNGPTKTQMTIVQQTGSIKPIPEPPKPKSIKKKLFIGLTAAAVLAFIVATVLLLPPKENPPLSDSSDMYSITLYAPSEMSLADFNISAGAVMERCKVLSNGEDFSFEKAEDRLSLFIHKSVFGEETPETVLRNYIVAPSELYLLDETNFNVLEFDPDTFLKLSREDIVSVTTLEAGILKGFNDEAHEEYPFLVLTLTDACIENISNTVRAWGGVVAAQDITQDNWGYWNSFLDLDERALYLEVRDGFSAIAAHNYQNPPLPDNAFEVEVHHEIEWESPETAFYPGKNQRAVTDLKGPTIQILFSSSLEKKLSGEWVDSELGLKRRLDFLESDYAFGSVIKDGKLFAVVKISPTHIGPPTLKLLTANSSLTLVSGLKSQYLDRSNTQSNIVSDDAGAVIYTIKTSKAGVNFRDLLNETSDGEIRLCIDNTPLLSLLPTQSITVKKDGIPLVYSSLDYSAPDIKELSFFNLHFNNHDYLNSDAIWLLNLIDDVFNGEYHIQFAADSYDFFAEEESVSFGIDYTEDINRLKEDLSTVIPDADFLVSMLSPFDIKVFLSLPVTEDLPEESLATVKSLYEAIDFENSAFVKLSVYLIDEEISEKERARLFFYKDIFDEKVECRYYFDHGRLDDYCAQFAELINEHEFYSRFSFTEF